LLRAPILGPPIIYPPGAANAKYLAGARIGFYHGDTALISEHPDLIDPRPPAATAERDPDEAAANPPAHARQDRAEGQDQT